jgi:glutamate racemase
MGSFGNGPGQIDTLVLGCTHYVFATPALRELVGQDIPLLSTGEPVARHTARLLDSQGLRADPRLNATLPLLLTNGTLSALQSAADRWLGLPPDQCHYAEDLA